MLSALSSSAYSTTAPNAGNGTQRANASGKTPAQQRAEQAQIAQLAATDRAVRAHEAAHLAAAQGLATSGANFGYTTGPDGKRYAISGEVSIDTSPASTPAETIVKAEHIHRAALAPADPSAQDRAVAAMADSMAARARLELNRAHAGAYAQNDAHAFGQQVDTAA